MLIVSHYLIASRIPPSLPIGLWVVGLSYLFLLSLLVGLFYLSFLVFMFFQFGPSGHPPIQPKEQLFNQPSEATQQNRTNQLISLLGCRIVGLLGHWVVWLKGCEVVGSLGHPPIQSKKQLFNQPRQATQPNQTKRPTNQPINPISRPSQKLKQPT